MTQPGPAADPYVWLEDVTGERALDWARRQNERSLAELTGDARFARFEADARRILEAQDRIADPVLMGGRVYNFWQDETQVRGILRRTDWESYAAGEPRWESLLDVDALSAREGRRGVTGMPSCLSPDYPIQDILVDRPRSHIGFMEIIQAVTEPISLRPARSPCRLSPWRRCQRSPRLLRVLSIRCKAWRWWSAPQTSFQCASLKSLSRCS